LQAHYPVGVASSKTTPPPPPARFQNLLEASPPAAMAKEPMRVLVTGAAGTAPIRLAPTSVVQCGMWSWTVGSVRLTSGSTDPVGL
jgi:hypothetical protein